MRTSGQEDAWSNVHNKIAEGVDECPRGRRSGSA
jgi:hypothetical protein